MRMRTLITRHSTLTQYAHKRRKVMVSAKFGNQSHEIGPVSAIYSGNLIVTIGGLQEC